MIIDMEQLLLLLLGIRLALPIRPIGLALPGAPLSAGVLLRLGLPFTTLLFLLPPPVFSPSRGVPGILEVRG